MSKWVPYPLHEFSRIPGIHIVQANNFIVYLDTSLKWVLILFKNSAGFQVYIKYKQDNFIVHLDTCLSGFLTPFMNSAGFQVYI